MPTFIKIGPLKKNLCGITSRGYVISRKGKIVLIKYGPINSNNRKFYWTGKKLPRLVPKEFSTINEAIKFYNSKIRMVNNEDYRKLPPGKKILKFKKVHTKEI